MFDPCNIAGLVAEYEGLSSQRTADIETALVTEHDWTQEAASELVQLATHKGSFLLRNALALAIAMGVEDGDQGF